MVFPPAASNTIIIYAKVNCQPKHVWYCKVWLHVRLILAPSLNNKASEDGPEDVEAAAFFLIWRHTSSLFWGFSAGEDDNVTSAAEGRNLFWSIGYAQLPLDVVHLYLTKFATLQYFTFWSIYWMLHNLQQFQSLPMVHICSMLTHKVLFLTKSLW